MANSAELQAQKRIIDERLARGDITQAQYAEEISQLEEQISQAQQNEVHDAEVEASHNQAAEKSNGFGGVFSLAAAPLAMARSRPQIIEEDSVYAEALQKEQSAASEKFKKDYEATHGEIDFKDKTEAGKAKIREYELEHSKHLLEHEQEHRETAKRNAYGVLDKKSKEGNIFKRISVGNKLNRYRNNELRFHRFGKDPTLEFMQSRSAQIAQRLNPNLKGKELEEKIREHQAIARERYFKRQEELRDSFKGTKREAWANKQFDRKKTKFDNLVNQLGVSSRLNSTTPKFSLKSFLPKRISVSQGFSSGFSRGLSSGLNGIARGISNLGNGIFNGISKMGNGIKNILNNLKNILSAVSKAFKFNLPLVIGASIGVLILVLVVSSLMLLGGGGGGVSGGPTPTPGPASSNALLNYNILLYNLIVQNCPPPNPHGNHGWEKDPYVIVTDHNGLGFNSCLDKIKSGLDRINPNTSKAVIQELKNEIIYDGYYVKTLHGKITYVDTLQCVGFSKAAAIGIGKPFDDSAAYYANNKYYTWISAVWSADGKRHNIPGGVQIGDVAIFTNQLNHIATVYDVSLSGGRRGYGGFDVVEANGGDGSVDITKNYNYDYDKNFAGVFRLNGK